MSTSDDILGLIWVWKLLQGMAWTYLQLPLRQWGASNVYQLVLSSWKVNIDENPIVLICNVDMFRLYLASHI